MSRPLDRVDDVDPLRLLDVLAAAIGGTGAAVQPIASTGRSLSAPSAPVRGATAEERVDDEVAIVIATSGSSGHPKRVALSAEAVLASATATERALGGPGRWVLAMPAHYVAGVQVLVRSIVAGTTPVALRGGVFAVDAFVEAVGETDRDGARRYTALVPAQVARLLEDDGGRAALAALDAVIVGGQAVPQALRDRAAAAGVRLVRSYGSSETAGGCVYDGRPLDGVAVRIRDGEIELGGATIAIGYLGEAERTAAAFRHDADGRWFRTGDTGRLDPAGVLDVLGRIDNVIVSGGVNVSLDRVEAVVRECPGWDDAVVVGVDDERWGSVPVVVIRSDAPDLALTDVRATVEASLGVAARPARIVRLDDVPMLATGKPDRRSVSALASQRGADG